MALTFMIGSQARFLTIDTSNEGLLHPDDPILTSYNEFRDQFGRDDLLVDDLLINFPENEQDLAALKDRVMANPVYRNQLVSVDGTFTAILLESDTYSAPAWKATTCWPDLTTR